MPRVTDIKVIDFGSATFEDGYHSSVVRACVWVGVSWCGPVDFSSAT